MVDLSKLAKPDKTIRKHTDEVLSAAKKLKEYGYIGEEISELLDLSIEYHDYGKINDRFQERVKSEKKIKFDIEKEVPHNILSIGFIPGEKFQDIEDYYRVCYAVFNHHQHGNNYETFKEKKTLLKEFNDKFEVKSIKNRTLNEIKEMAEDKKTILLKGFLHKCDYAASGEYEVEYPNNFLRNSLENMGYSWNELQKFCKTNSDENIIAIANTGMGKTEGGLLWMGDNKGFFILPLRTAINSIYKRIIEDIVKENKEERVALLHSDSLSYYLKEEVTEEGKALAYNARGRELSMPLTISTLDQLFDFVYKYNGYELKLATLSYSKIVIDEIQAYSPDLLAYLIYGLEKIVSVGGKFAILTATLPPFIKDLLEKNEKIGKVKYEKFIKGKDRHSVEILEEKLNVDMVYDHYIKKGGKTLIICNTVKESQRVYRELKERGIEQLNLLHAKFIKKDRSEKEKKILEFGKTEVIKTGIWVSTSLVEASLDIDFDYLFTELNDLTGFFQRLGRVNRKGKKDIEETNAYLFTEIDKGLLITSSTAKKGFIDKDIYELSKEALIGFKGILSEEKKFELMENSLTTSKLERSPFWERYRDVKNYIENLYLGEMNLEETKKMFRDIIAYNVIPNSIYEDNEKRIEELAQIIREGDKLERIKAKYELEEFCVSVGIYDMNYTGKQVDLKFEKIDIIECDYSTEMGFVRKNKNNNVDEINGNFFE